MAKKEILVGYGVDIDAVGGWLGSYGGEDSPDDISRGLFAGEVGVPRLLKLFKKNNITATFFAPGHSIETFPEQMKMILTRFGFGSHMVVTGDVTQIDLPAGRKSGLIHAARVLNDVPGISINYFDEKDVVRHEIVGAIIKAYERFDRKQEENRMEELGKQHDH